MSTQVINKLATTVLDACKKKGEDAFNTMSYFVLEDVSKLDCDVVTAKFTELYEATKTGNGNFTEAVANLHNAYSLLFKCSDGYCKAYNSLKGGDMSKENKVVTVEQGLRQHVWNAYVAFEGKVDKQSTSLPTYGLVRKFALGVKNGSLITHNNLKDLDVLYAALTSFAAIFSWENKRLGIYDETEVIQDLSESLFVALSQIGEAERFEEEMVRATGNDEWRNSNDKADVWDKADAYWTSAVAMEKPVDRLGMTSAIMCTLYSVVANDK